MSVWYVDPEAPEPSDTETGLRYCIEDAQAAIGHAERALDKGDFQQAIDYLQSASKTLSKADWS
jgi:DNA-binding MurR/RpiR family transcriptional regulator